MSEHSAEKDVPLVHYLHPGGWMLHAVATGFGTLDAKTDWSKVTCRICLAAGPHPITKHATYPCPTGDCPGDGRYAAPGRGHLTTCAYPRDIPPGVGA